MKGFSFGEAPDDTHLACYLEKSRLTRADYSRGGNLTEAQLALINEPRDIPYIAFIDNIYEEHFIPIEGSFSLCREYESHYDGLHHLWINRDKEFLAARLGREPNLGELWRDLDETQEPLRFGAFYLLRYPENMRWKEANWGGLETDAGVFLLRAGQIFSKNYVELVQTPIY